MFENVINFFKKIGKKDQIEAKSKDTAKERLHLVLMQDRANVSADFLDLMKQEIIEVIKKYVVVDEKEIDVRLTNQANDDGTNGAPALYANIPIVNIKNDLKGEKMREQEAENKEKEEKMAEKKEAPKRRGRKPKKVVDAEKMKNEEQEENTDEDTELDEEVETEDVIKEDSDEVETEEEENMGKEE